MEAEVNSVRKAAVGLGWTLVIGLWACALAKMIGRDAHFVLILLSAATGYLYVPAWGVAAAAGMARRWGMFAASMGLVGMHLVWLRPQGWIREPPPETGPSLRVMNANVLMVNHDTEGILAEVLAAQPDVLFVQELAPQWAEAFESEPLMAALPYRIFIAREDSFGIGLYSRLPLIDPKIEDLAGLPWIRASIVVDGRAIELWNAHTLPPRTLEYSGIWDGMMAFFVEQAESSQGTVIFSGDLNTTPAHKWYARLTNTRLRESHEACGRGWATTWPNGVFPIPPLRLDHVFISEDLGCVSVQEGEGRGSDHLPLIVDLRLQ